MWQSKGRWGEEVSHRNYKKITFFIFSLCATAPWIKKKWFFFLLRLTHYEQSRVMNFQTGLPIRSPATVTKWKKVNICSHLCLFVFVHIQQILTCKALSAVMVCPLQLLFAMTWKKHRQWDLQQLHSLIIIFKSGICSMLRWTHFYHCWKKYLMISRST